MIRFKMDDQDEASLTEMVSLFPTTKTTVLETSTSAPTMKMTTSKSDDDHHQPLVNHEKNNNHDYNDSNPNRNNKHKFKLKMNNNLNEPASTPTHTSNNHTSTSIHRNFLLFSTLFSLNHGTVVSCLSLATARLGNDLGAYQSSALYGSYTLSALLGATYVVKRLGGSGKGAVVLGMWIYCAYVACFALAALLRNENNENGGNGDGDGDGYNSGNNNDSLLLEIIILLSGILGGIGGGFLWMAQGTYFSRVSSEYATSLSIPVSDASNELAGSFAAIYLGGELCLRLFSTIAIGTFGWSWNNVFLMYTAIAIGSAVLMGSRVTWYGQTEEEALEDLNSSVWTKATLTVRVLRDDWRMKYMIPLCVVFGFAAAFVTSFVNGEVLLVALDDVNSLYVGFLGSVTAAVAAVFSIVFGWMAKRTGNGLVLVLGCVAFSVPSGLFLLWPGLEEWGFWSLLGIYGLQGVGRATFEGNLRAEFAVLFGNEKEGAFGNIIFWNGLAMAVGFLLTAKVRCAEVGTYCIQYKDGSLHDVLLYELLVLASAALTLCSFWRLSYVRKQEERRVIESRFSIDQQLV